MATGRQRFAIDIDVLQIGFYSGHTGCVNALEFSGDEQLLLSGLSLFLQELNFSIFKGGDDGGVDLWHVNEFISREEPKPKRIMKSRHYSNIFSLGFTLDGTAGIQLDEFQLNLLLFV